MKFNDKARKIRRAGAQVIDILVVTWQRLKSALNKIALNSIAINNIAINKDLPRGVFTFTVALYKQNPLRVAASALLFFMVVFAIIVFLSNGGNDTPVTTARSALEVPALHKDSALTGEIDRDRLVHDLEISALAIFRDDDWNKKQIIDFSYHWNELTGDEKSEIKQSVWFQLLENALINKITADRTATGFKHNRTKLLVALSDKLEIQLPQREDLATVKVTNVITENNATSRTNTRNEAARTSEANPVASSVTMKSIETTGVQQIAQQTAQKNTQQSMPLRQAQTRGSTATAQPHNVDATRAASNPAPSGVEKNTNIFSRQNPTGSKPVNRAATSLAAAKPVTQSSTPAATAVITQSTTNKSTTKSATKSTAVTLAPSTSAKAQPSDRPRASTPAVVAIRDTDLQTITNRFISSYEKGNITSFASLFAKNAVSNDASGLATIKKEYGDLFATTSERRMIIGGLKWNFSNNKAVGDGHLEVAVKPNGAGQAQTYAGKIQIVVEKHGDGVQITKLYHALK